jgi:putative transposase
MDSNFCLNVLEEALRKNGTPEIFNLDQGNQFTSEKFTSTLLDQGVKISMDGKGRALDNAHIERVWRSLKYEDIVTTQRV